MTVTGKKIITFLILLIWMAVIFFFSAQKGTDSAEISHSVAYRIAEWGDSLFQQGKTEKELVQQAENMQFFIRKGAHMSEYAVLAVLFLMHLCCYEKRPKNLLLWTWLFCTMFAATDEIHQLFIPGRAGQFQDVCIDSGGSLIGAGIFILFHKKRKRKSIENRQ